jgi:hypothetical protein
LRLEGEEGESIFPSASSPSHGRLELAAGTGQGRLHDLEEDVGVVHHTGEEPGTGTAPKADTGMSEVMCQGIPEVSTSTGWSFAPLSRRERPEVGVKRLFRRPH